MQAQERSVTNPHPADDERGALREAMLVFGAISVLTWLLSRGQNLPILRTHLHLVVGMLFLVTALRCAERRPGGAARYGLAFAGVLADEDDVRGQTDRPDSDRRSLISDLWQVLRAGLPRFLSELGVALLVCAVVFPPFVLGFYFWNSPLHPFIWAPDPELPEYALTQVIVVGLPEEALFRGYLQGRLEEAWPEKIRVLGVPLGLRAWLCQALLFAILHFVVDYNPARLAVFFPALLFGWVRSLRKGIGAAVFVHAACNVLSDILIRGFL
jgi:membrane protease YdiL (CAAX protease family)